MLSNPTHEGSDSALPAFDESECEGSLPIRFERMVARHGSRIAVKTSRGQLTYQALNDKANVIANAVLQKCGSSQKPVSLLFQPGASEIAAILGILKSGNFYVPLNTSHPLARTVQILQDAEPALLLTDTHHEERALGLGQSVLNVENLNGTPVNTRNIEQNGDALAYILYTSGSSGEPKGVLHTHRNVLFDTRQQRIDLQTTTEDRYGLLFSSSSSASVYNIFGALLNGAAVLPFDLRERGLERLTHWLVAEEITILEITVAAFRQWCASLDKHKPKVGELFPKLRLLAPGGEPVYKRDFELYQRHFAPICVMQNGLGSTETRTIAQYFLNHQTLVSQSLVPVGDVAAGKEVLLLDENRQLVESGEIGEIAVRSRYLSPGYWRRPELTEAAFLPDPKGGEYRTYLTGDLGQYDEQGRLVHLGRKDFQVKIRGYRIEIAEVEMALSKLTWLPVAAAAFTDESGNKQLAAYLAVRRRSFLSIRELRDQLREQLPDYAVPTRFEFLDALPLTFNGKLDRRALPTPKPVRATSDEEFVKPSGRTESKIAHLFEEILAIDSVGATDDFFALGGHSLLAAQLTLRIEEEFGQFLSLSAILEAPTVRDLSLLFQHEKTSHRETLVQIQAGDGVHSRPPLFCLPGAGGNALQFHRFASYLESDQAVYGFDCIGMEGRFSPHKTIEAMSEHYLAEIKAVQPKMPYLLCGFSMGGLVAFEIARRLRAAGDEVALLALFDTDCRDHKKLSSRKHWRARIATRTRIRNRCRQLQYLWCVKRGQIAPRHVAVRHVEWIHSLATDHYFPREYPDVITYFRAKGRTDCPEQFLTDGGWHFMTGARVEAHDILGNHHLIQEPYVGELAQQMRCCIENALRQE